MDHYQVIKRPLITEKGMRSNEEHNTVVFQVDRKANKLLIKQAIEVLFQVKVLGGQHAERPWQEKAGTYA